MALPVERFDEAVGRQGHARRVGRKSPLARSLACQIESTIWLQSLTPNLLSRLHHGLIVRQFKPLRRFWNVVVSRGRRQTLDELGNVAFVDVERR